ncbi:unnamed protein product [Heterobilharzia americana]|nr:unnamed protein product [Heterobilharzia americana]
MLDGVKDFTVSSTLQKNFKEFGKAHLFDKLPETCWHSDCGSPQWILLVLDNIRRLTSLKIQFQGGFSSPEVKIEGWSDDEQSKCECLVFPEDNNSVQTFDIPLLKGCSSYRFVLTSLQICLVALWYMN